MGYPDASEGQLREAKKGKDAMRLIGDERITRFYYHDQDIDLGLVVYRRTMSESGELIGWETSIPSLSTDWTECSLDEVENIENKLRVP